MTLFCTTGHFRPIRLYNKKVVHAIWFYRSVKSFILIKIDFIFGETRCVLVLYQYYLASMPIRVAENQNYFEQTKYPGYKNVNHCFRTVMRYEVPNMDCFTTLCSALWAKYTCDKSLGPVSLTIFCPQFKFDETSVRMRGRIRSHFWILGKFRHSKSKFYKILDEIAHFFGLERVWDLDLSGHELFMQPRLILSTEMAG